jgi:acetoacetyl-CoA synthetase
MEPAGQLGAFMRGVSVAIGRPLREHAGLDAWAAANWRDFWRHFTSAVRAPLGIHGDAEPVCVGDDCEHAQFFPGLQLNYADALLSLDVAPAQAPALVVHGADGESARWSRGELRERVARLAAALRTSGLRPGDRVAMVARNDGDAVVVALAVTAIGATLSTAAPDMGPDALLDRFTQVAPRWLFAHVQPRPFDSGMPLPDKLVELLTRLASVEVFVRIDGESLAADVTPLEVTLDGLRARDAPQPFDWPKFPFGHPLFVMFTSGTTGPPKCLVHGAGGTLLEHVKEHRLHIGLAPGDTLFYQTGCSWMMWNWQLSALASGAAIVTYPGPVATADTLWHIAASERVTVFGTSPPYLLMSQEAKLVPRASVDFGALRAVLSTGSVLHDWQYAWVRDNVKDVPLWSISGGTDIIGCFVLGSPLLPVHAGESPCRSLGLDVQVRDGQLVCANPFPSRPLGFLDDADGARFHAAYFTQNPGDWSHGDAAEQTERGGFRILGRLDGVLNVRGIKVSPGEIARVLLAAPGIRDTLIVEQSWQGGSRVVALLRLAPGATLDGAKIAALRSELARRLSNAHVPDLFVQVDELPVTHSGKTSESAARRAVNGQPVPNESALRNPQCLAAIRTHPALQADAHATAAGTSIADQVAGAWAEVFALPPPVDTRADFFELGGNSLMAARLLSRLAGITGRALPVSTLLNAPTVERIVATLDRGAPRDQSSQVFPVRPGTGRPVFLVHGLSGTVMECRSLLAQLKCARPVYGFQARGVDDGLAPQERVADMAARYAQAVREVQPHGPYAVWGFSFGGLVALEIARILAGQGESIEHVGLIDTYVQRDLGRIAATIDRARRGLRLAWNLRPSQWRNYLSGRSRPPPHLPPAAQRVHDAMMRALGAYAPRPFDAGPVVYLRAVLPLGGYPDPLPVWRRVAGARLRIVRVPGGHLDLVGPTSTHAARAVDAALGLPRPPAVSPPSAPVVLPASEPGPASSHWFRTRGS